MPDMLVKLYDLDHRTDFLSAQAALGVSIRKPIGPEKQAVIRWVGRQFSEGWASEADVALSREPGACFIAVKADHLIGFACYDATALGFFGPIGVHADFRGCGTGEALLRACLRDMWFKGYGYAVVGQTTAFSFYEKAVGAVAIPGSTPGIYGPPLG